MSRSRELSSTDLPLSEESLRSWKHASCLSGSITDKPSRSSPNFPYTWSAKVVHVTALFGLFFTYFWGPRINSRPPRELKILVSSRAGRIHRPGGRELALPERPAESLQEEGLPHSKGFPVGPSMGLVYNAESLQED